MIQLNGSTITPAKRLWAFANYSRFVRPGAVRIGASSNDSNLEVIAFSNHNGSLAIVVLNTATTDITTSFALHNSRVTGPVFPYLTNTTNDTAAQNPFVMHDGVFTVTIATRSLITYFIP